MITLAEFVEKYLTLRALVWQYKTGRMTFDDERAFEALLIGQFNGDMCVWNVVKLLLGADLGQEAGVK